MRRLIDFLIALTAVVILMPVLLVVAIVVKLTSKGPVLYWSDRIGLDNETFGMPKFRTMRINTPSLATHLLEEPESYLTSVGGFLRKTSLDELPQLWSILKGEMAIVGPRPALYNQDDLIALRTELGVHKLLPGLTGWAQINGRDEIPIPEKVALDVEYLDKKSLLLDIHIVWKTFLKVVSRKDVSH